MRKTVEESEQAEPLLSKQLYDTIRDAHQDQTAQAMDAGGQLLEKGFVEEARKAEAEAGKGVSKLRQGVEKAADSVLGDETEALRRPRRAGPACERTGTGDARNGGGGLPATQPTTGPTRGGSQVARNNPTTRGAGRRGGEEQPGEAQPNGNQPGEQPEQVARRLRSARRSTRTEARTALRSAATRPPAGTRSTTGPATGPGATTGRRPTARSGSR